MVLDKDFQIMVDEGSKIELCKNIRRTRNYLLEELEYLLKYQFFEGGVDLFVTLQNLWWKNKQ